MRKQNQTLRQNQSGLVSFMVVSVLMLVLTLIVISYARIVSREQIQTLDRQLNTQALYAAESGVNDAVKALADPNMPAFGNDCAAPNNFIKVANDNGLLDPNLDDGVSYECIIVNEAVPKLLYPGATTNQSIVTKLQGVDSGGNDVPIGNIKITWEGHDPNRDTDTVRSGCPSVAGEFQANLPNCDFGMIRFELIDFSTDKSLNGLMTNRWIGILEPPRTGATGSSGGDRNIFNGPDNNNQGSPVLASCSGQTCEYEIRGLDISVGYLRIRSLYKNTPFEISATDTSGQPVNLKGSQVEIDVTGRAGGVIKRIKVNRQVGNSFAGAPAPEFAIQTKNTICKGFLFTPGGSPVVSVPATTEPEKTICDPTKQ